MNLGDGTNQRMVGHSPNCVCWVCINKCAACRDKEAELDRLRADNERLRAAASAVVEARKIYGASRTLTDVIEELAAILASTEKEGKCSERIPDYYTVIHEDEIVIIRAQYDALMAAAKALFSIEERVMDGTSNWVTEQEALAALRAAGVDVGET